MTLFSLFFLIGDLWVGIMRSYLGEEDLPPELLPRGSSLLEATLTTSPPLVSSYIHIQYTYLTPPTWNNQSLHCCPGEIQPALRDLQPSYPLLKNYIVCKFDQLSTNNRSLFNPVPKSFPGIQPTRRNLTSLPLP
jgi:hypothetical protein